MANMSDVVAAFGEEHASQLTGISMSQLRYWDRTDFYRPSYAEANRRLPFSRVYSFKDIVALRVLNVLRNQFGVSLHHLRAVSARLSHLAEDRWTGVRLYVLKKKVIWHDPGTKLPQEIVSGQYVIPVVLSEVVDDTARDVAQLNHRDVSEHGIIQRSRFVSHNAPVISGTRISVRAIKRFAEAGYTKEQIVEEYPDLTIKDVDAALAYEAQATA